jgi:hypothetical protein
VDVDLADVAVVIGDSPLVLLMDAPVVLVDAAFLLAHALFFCPVVLVYAAVVLIDLSFNALPFLAVELIHLHVVCIDLPTMLGLRLPDRTFVGSSIHVLGLSSTEDELVFVLRMSYGGCCARTSERPTQRVEQTARWSRARQACSNVTSASYHSGTRSWPSAASLRDQASPLEAIGKLAPPDREADAGVLLPSDEAPPARLRVARKDQTDQETLPASI